MKKQIRFEFVLIIFYLFALCSNIIAQDVSNGSIKFIFEPENSLVQFAIWVEDENGDYVETVFLTNFIGRYGGGNRTGDEDIDLTIGNRLSALPI